MANKKYSSKVKNDIISSYLTYFKYVDKLQPQKVARYAKDVLGYDNITYQDFTRDSEIKLRIYEFNKNHKKIKLLGKRNSHQFVRLPVDEILKDNINDINSLRTILYKFNDKYKFINDELLKADAEIEKLKKEIENVNEKNKCLDDEIKELKVRNRELSVKNRQLAANQAKAKKIESFLLSIDIYEDLLKRKKVDVMNEENFRLLLANSGLLKCDDLIKDKNIKLIDELYPENMYQDNVENDESGNVDDELPNEMSDENYLDFFKAKYGER